MSKGVQKEGKLKDECVKFVRVGDARKGAIVFLILPSNYIYKTHSSIGFSIGLRAHVS